MFADESIVPELNPEGLNDYLTFQFCLSDKTLFKGVKKLLPGHWARVSARSFKLHRYWALDFSVVGRQSEEFFQNKLNGLLEDSVRLCLRSDVPVGAYLSGGMDSSAVTCIASGLNKGNIFQTFTGAFREGKEFDETGFARIVSAFAGTRHHEIYLSPKNFRESFARIIYGLDEPVAGPGAFPQYFVSELASRNVKVVLGGQGGDEIFGGYTRYLIAYLEECIRGAILQTREGKDFVVTFESILPNLPQLRGYEPLLQYFWQDGLFQDMDRRYFRLIRKDLDLKGAINPEFLPAESEYNQFEVFQDIFNRPPLGSYINRMTHFDINTLLPALLQVEDRMSMAHSLESRVPLLDHRIVELVASIPPTVKFRGGQTKHIFRKAVEKRVPAEIVSRKDKMGFPVPLSQWYTRDLTGFVSDILLDDRTRRRGIFDTAAIEQKLTQERRYGRSIWGLLCLEMWFRTFIDRC